MHPRKTFRTQILRHHSMVVVSPSPYFVALTQLQHQVEQPLLTPQAPRLLVASMPFREHYAIEIEEKGKEDVG